MIGSRGPQSAVGLKAYRILPIIVFPSALTISTTAQIGSCIIPNAAIVHPAAEYEREQKILSLLYSKLKIF